MDKYFIKEKGFTKYIIMLSIPILFQSLLYVGVSAINSLMFGYFGETEMAGYSQANQVFYIYTIMTYGFASTCKILVAQFWGSKNQYSMRGVLGYSLRMGMIFGVIAMAVFLAVPVIPMKIFSSDPAVVELGCQFLRVIAVACIFYAVSNILYNAFSGIEKTQMYLYGNLIAYGLNLAINYILIFGKFGFPRLGIVGAGIGVLVGRLAEFLYLFITFLRSPEFGFKVSDLKWKLESQLHKDYYHIFRSIMGHEIIYSIGISMAQIIMGHISTLAVSAYNICYVLFSIATTPATALSAACQTALGKIIGTGDLARAKRASNSMLILTLYCGIISAFLMIISGNFFISLYNLSETTVVYAKQIMPVMIVTAFFTAFEYTALVNILRSGGDGFTGFITDCITMWCIAIPLAWLAAMKWELAPVLVIAFIKCDMPLKSAVGVIAVLRGKWLRNYAEKAETPAE